MTDYENIDTDELLDASKNIDPKTFGQRIRHAILFKSGPCDPCTSECPIWEMCQLKLVPASVSGMKKN